MTILMNEYNKENNNLIDVEYNFETQNILQGAY